MDYSASSDNSPSTPRRSNIDRRLLPVCPHRPRSNSSISVVTTVDNDDDEEMAQYQTEKGIPFFPTLASVSSTSSTCMILMSGSQSSSATSPKRKRNHTDTKHQYQNQTTATATEVRIHDISTCQQKVPKLQPRFQSRPVHANDNDNRRPSTRRTQQSDVHNVSATSIDFSSSITSVDLPFLDLSLKEEMAATNTATDDLDLDFVWDKAEIDIWMSPKKK